MIAFYNEFEPFAAACLRELIKAGVIADGEVSEKDMWDVVPSELMGFNQVHLCAGIGGWSAALRLAGWPDDKPVCTVSLPCQPFSAAGKGKGLADERGQLAEAFFWLAGICRPHVIFGEQVEAAIKHDWLDVMASQLESIGYTVGSVGFPAASVGAFHIRQRLYWCANLLAKPESNRSKCSSTPSKKTGWRPTEFAIRSPARGVADAEHSYRRSEYKIDAGAYRRDRPGRSGPTGIIGDSGEQGLERHEQRGTQELGTRPYGSTCESSKSHFWADAEWIPCRDGKAMPTKPGLFPLAHGIRNRVGTLRGAGNAIVPQAAAEFIRAFMGTQKT